MSAAISTDTSHSTVKGGQLGQNLLGRNEDFRKDKSIRLRFLSRYTVYYAKEIGCYSLVCEQPGASGREQHVSLPFLTQPKETYNHKCHCCSTSHKHRRMTEHSFLLLEEQDGDDDDDDENHSQHWSHNPQHFWLVHPLSHACMNQDWVRVGTGGECHL